MQLQVNQIGFDYREREMAFETKPLLTDICFTVSSGTLLHLRGENGSGKTTLLKLIAGLLFPQTGEISFLDTNIWHNLALYQSKLCYVGHKAGISQSLTVLENCRYDLKNAHETEIFRGLEQFGLLAFQHTPCGLLSAGQCRRVGLLRLFLSKAPLWILDEPLVALDDASIDILMQAMTQHLAQGGLIVMTSHQALPYKLVGYRDYLLC